MAQPQPREQNQCHWVAMSWATWVWFQHSAETLCSPSTILRGTEPVSALTHALLYCCSLSLSLSQAFLGFSQWPSFDFQCFGALGVGPGAQTQPLVWAWSMGKITAIVKPPSKCHKSASAMKYQKYFKTRAKSRPMVTVYQPSRPRLGHALIFDSKIFLSNLLLKINILCVTKKPSLSQFFKHLDLEDLSWF